MRTKKSTVILLVCFLYLTCLVQQCHQFAFQFLANSMSNGLGVASAVGMALMHSMMQSMITTIAHGFSTMHTMSMALASGFVMGHLALAGFIFFLLAIVPAEERRSLGGNSIFSPYRHLITYHENATVANASVVGYGLQFSNSSLIRHKRATLVNNVATKNATDEPFTLPASLARITYAEEGTSRQMSDSDSRLPRLFSGIVQRDPLNCLPLIMCGLSAARKPNERTEVMNDYAYLLKEMITPDEDDRSEEDEGSLEVDLKTNRNRNRYRSPLEFQQQLAALFGARKEKDDVDKMIDDMEKEEDENIEDLVLTDMASDPNDLKFALDDIKIRGLKKTVSKMPAKSKKTYISHLMKDDNDSLEDDHEIEPGRGLLPPMHMMGTYPRHDYPPPRDSSMEEEYLFNSRELTRGGYPPPPPLPPGPISYRGRIENDQLYKKNLKILEQSLPHPHSGFFRLGRPHIMTRRTRRNARWDRPPPPRGFLQKKRGEAANANNIYERSRIGAEIGAATRSNRQCRALFNQCPLNGIAKPMDDGTPFLNRAVNNIRRVLLGTPPGGTKQKRINEIKEVIQQLHPSGVPSQSGSEVKVVLNIGPSAPPGTTTLHRTGAHPHTISYPPPPMHQIQTSDSPSPPPPRKTMNYYPPTAEISLPKPSSTIATIPLKNLAEMIKSTMASFISNEGSTDMPVIETTIFSQSPNSIENDEPAPTNLPAQVSKDKYVENLRETIDIFKRFKEAHKKGQSAHSQSSTQPTLVVKTTMISPFEQEQMNVTKIMTKLALALAGKNPSEETPQKDLEADDTESGADQDEVQDDYDIKDALEPEDQGDVDSLLSFLKKFREKKKHKGKKKKKKHNKKKKGESSEENSSEENGGGGGDHHYHHPHHTTTTLVAVPPPYVRKQINWKSGSSLFKDGLYHLLFGKRETKPLPPIKKHYSAAEDFSKKPIRHDVHYTSKEKGPVVQHVVHHDQRFRSEEIGSMEDDEGEPTTLPLPDPTEISTSLLGSSESATVEVTPRPFKIKVKEPTQRPTKKKKSKKQPKPTVATERPIKIKFKNPNPLPIPEDSEEEDEEEYEEPFRYANQDMSGSMEYDSYEEHFRRGTRPTRPQLLFTPFAHASTISNKRSITGNNSKKGGKKSNREKQNLEIEWGSKRSRSNVTTTSSPQKFKKRMSPSTVKLTTTSTVKPKRKIMKYKNG